MDREYPPPDAWAEGRTTLITSARVLWLRSERSNYRTARKRSRNLQPPLSFLPSFFLFQKTKWRRKNITQIILRESGRRRVSSRPVGGLPMASDLCRWSYSLNQTFSNMVPRPSFSLTLRIAIVKSCTIITFGALLPPLLWPPSVTTPTSMGRCVFESLAHSEARLDLC